MLSGSGSSLSGAGRRWGLLLCSGLVVAHFASLSAFLFPSMLLWLEIQQRFMSRFLS